jgi:hypothetical protein
LFTGCGYAVSNYCRIEWPAWGASQYQIRAFWIAAYLGYVRGQRQWRTTEGDLLLTWDRLHGEIEAYDRLGRHVGVRDARSGEWIKEAIRGRRIDV